jgi:hypothetical protein
MRRPPHGITLLGRTLQNHPPIKRAIASVARSAGLFRDSPANDFCRERTEVRTRGGDAFSKLFYRWACPQTKEARASTGIRGLLRVT